MTSACVLLHYTWRVKLYNGTNGQLVSWPYFLHALELRFAPSQYEDPKGELFKLCQTSSIRDYQAQFESLANRVVGLPPTFFFSYFISGLKPEIRREVQALQPVSLPQAISLAKLQEDKLHDIPSLARSHLPHTFPSQTRQFPVTTTPVSPSIAS